MRMRHGYVATAILATGLGATSACTTPPDTGTTTTTAVVTTTTTAVSTTTVGVPQRVFTLDSPACKAKLVVTREPNRIVRVAFENNSADPRMWQVFGSGSSANHPSVTSTEDWLTPIPGTTFRIVILNTRFSATACYDGWESTPTKETKR